MSVKFGSFNVKAEIGQAVEKVQTALRGALHPRKQKKFERGVSFKSAKVKAKVAKAPRKDMSSAEIANMDEARTSSHLVARDSFAAPSVVSPSEAAKQLFDSIEAGNVKGYVASLRTLMELAGEEGERGEANNKALTKIFGARSQPSRLIMANNIRAMHEAVASKAEAHADILDQSEMFSEFLRLAGEVAPVPAEQDNVPSRSAVAKRLFNSIEAGNVKGYVAGLKSVNDLGSEEAQAFLTALAKSSLQDAKRKAEAHTGQNWQAEQNCRQTSRCGRAGQSTLQGSVQRFQIDRGCEAVDQCAQ